MFRESLEHVNKMMSWTVHPSFLSHEQLDRAAGKVKMASKPILEETLIRLLYVLWQVAEESKCRELGGELCDVFDLHHLSLPHGWGIVLYLGKHCVHQFGCAYLC